MADIALYDDDDMEISEADLIKRFLLERFPRKKRREQRFDQMLNQEVMRANFNPLLGHQGPVPIFVSFDSGAADELNSLSQQQNEIIGKVTHLDVAQQGIVDQIKANNLAAAQVGISGRHIGGVGDGEALDAVLDVLGPAAGLHPNVLPAVANNARGSAIQRHVASGGVRNQADAIFNAQMGADNIRDRARLQVSEAVLGQAGSDVVPMDLVGSANDLAQKHQMRINQIRNNMALRADEQRNFTAQQLAQEEQKQMNEAQEMKEEARRLIQASFHRFNAADDTLEEAQNQNIPAEDIRELEAEAAARLKEYERVRSILRQTAEAPLSYFGDQPFRGIPAQPPPRQSAPAPNLGRLPSPPPVRTPSPSPAPPSSQPPPPPPGGGAVSQVPRQEIRTVIPPSQPQGGIVIPSRPASAPAPAPVVVDVNMEGARRGDKTKDRGSGFFRDIDQDRPSKRRRTAPQESAPRQAPQRAHEVEDADMLDEKSSQVDDDEKRRPLTQDERDRELEMNRARIIARRMRRGMVGLTGDDYNAILPVLQQLALDVESAHASKTNLQYLQYLKETFQNEVADIRAQIGTNAARELEVRAKPILHDLSVKMEHARGHLEGAEFPDFEDVQREGDNPDRERDRGRRRRRSGSRRRRSGSEGPPINRSNLRGREL